MHSTEKTEGQPKVMYCELEPSIRCVHLNSKGRPSKGGPQETMDPFVLKWQREVLILDNTNIGIWTEIKVSNLNNSELTL